MRHSRHNHPVSIAQDEFDESRLIFGRFQAVSWTASTGSTNVDLTAMAKLDPAVARVLIADEQTAGRGRRDRRWDAPPGGGLLISFYVPWVQRETVHLVATCLGVAAVDAARSVRRTVGLKWPNDVIAPNGAKVGGMLGNTVVDGVDLQGAVIGLGCNVHWPPPGEPGFDHATSLDRLGTNGLPLVSRTEMANALIRGFEQRLCTVEAGGSSALHDAYRTRCYTLGAEVRVQHDGGDFTEGTAVDIDASGALVIDVGGVQRRVDVGDVIHLRPKGD